MRAIWEHTAHLADSLRSSPVVARFGGNLRGEPQRPDSQLPSLLEHLFAGFGQLQAQPLLLVINLAHIPGAADFDRDPAGPQFREDGFAIAGAGLAIIEWLRSRMARYPIRFKLPYTDPHSSRVADDGFPDAHWPWPLDGRKSRFHFLPDVAPQVSNALGVPAQPLREALFDLRSALMESSAWSEYDAAAGALNADDELVLDDLLNGYRAATRADVIDAVEPRRVMRRMQHRHAALRETEARARALGGRVAAYYAAFRGLDNTFDDIARVLSQPLFYGTPRIAAVYKASWRWRDDQSRLDVRFQTDGILQRLNEVVRVEVDLGSLSGLIVVEGYTVSLHRRGTAFVEDVNVTGVVLPESA